MNLLENRVDYLLMVQIETTVAGHHMPVLAQDI
jgi:hypothetical protein